MIKKFTCLKCKTKYYFDDKDHNNYFSFKTEKGIEAKNIKMNKHVKAENVPEDEQEGFNCWIQMSFCVECDTEIFGVFFKNESNGITDKVIHFGFQPYKDYNITDNDL